MEAKDTVMDDEEIKGRQMAGKPWELWRLRKVAEAQAEISFKAGVKEVVDFNTSMGIGTFSPKYQGKLKEWGL